MEKQEQDNQEDLGDWNNYVGAQKLTPAIVGDKKTPFVCIDVTHKDYDGDKKVVLSFENKETEYFLTLNKTNLTLVMDKGIATPRDCIGRIFYFGIRKVTNPKDGKLMDSLYIDNITEKQ